ncbi:hypothetical protein ACFQ1M_01210 [Sungkyunkwania multivorans]|uniref:Uncharacterized protein n=1 Tax=Sungkyunkwania multivorans TaxID=1173618 RepID=A0ABW3CSR9_9FLAO
MSVKKIENFRSTALKNEEAIMGGVNPEPIYDENGNIIGWKSCTDHPNMPQLPGNTTIQ